MMPNPPVSERSGDSDGEINSDSGTSPVRALAEQAETDYIVPYPYPGHDMGDPHREVPVSYTHLRAHETSAHL
eukprot:2908543-Alexandrium_andersonii.AAC.1